MLVLKLHKLNAKTSAVYVVIAYYLRRSSSVQRRQGSDVQIPNCAKYSLALLLDCLTWYILIMEISLSFDPFIELYGKAFQVG